MSNVAKLKKQAAEFEQKKQFDKALAVYIKLLESFDQYPDEIDVALFNRVGDLMLRQGNVADAVDYYEQAIDRYADTGFFNNAIALCNKILRHSPGRALVYYKLGKISAQKGFKNDAKVNFLEYADRMRKGGKVDESFRALKEFADLCPDQDEIRLMLADQLTKADRQAEAIDQLQTLYERYESEGRVTEATATVARMRAIDPGVEPRSGGGSQKSTTAELVFLDLDAPSSKTMPAAKAAPLVHRRVAPFISAPHAPSTLGSGAPPRPITPVGRATGHPVAPQRHGNDKQPGLERITETPPDDTPLAEITRVGDDGMGSESTPYESLSGLETTRIADNDIIRSTPSNSLLDLEPTSLDPRETQPLHRSSAPTHASQDEPDSGSELGVVELKFIMPDPEAEPAPSMASIDFELSTLTTPPLSTPPHVPAGATPSTSQVALDGLPLMDLDIPVVPPSAHPPRVAESLEEMSLSNGLELIDDRVQDSRVSSLIADSELTNAGADAPAIEEDDVLATMPTPSVARRSTMVAVQSVAVLGASVQREPDNWSLRRELAEAMLEAGDRYGGIRELEAAMGGAERGGDLNLASALAEEIARLEPEIVKHHQKRVEYAFRTNDRSRLIEAYLSLADALLRSEQADKARTVYQRVIDLAPDELRAQTALETIVVPEPEPPPAEVIRASGSASRRTTSIPQIMNAPAPAADNESFVNLGDWLRDDEAPKDTRMVVAEQEPSGDEDADFADMLRKFKQGVAENVDAEDYQSHYDLAIAYKEMGLLDEAIAEFQKALGSPTNRVPTYEALGQCFLDKGQHKLASAILSRALNERASEEQLVGVLYLLGLSAEAQGNAEEALGFYQRVFVLDIQFRDIVDRLTEVEGGGAAR